MISDGKILGITAQIDLGNVAVAIVTLLAIAFAWNSNRINLKYQSDSIKNTRKIEQIDKIFDDISEFLDRSIKVCSIENNRSTVILNDIPGIINLDIEEKYMNRIEEFSFFTSKIVLKLSILDDYSSQLSKCIADVNICAQEGDFEKLEIKHASLRKELRNWAEKHGGLLTIKSKGN